MTANKDEVVKQGDGEKQKQEFPASSSGQSDAAGQGNAQKKTKPKQRAQARMAAAEDASNFRLPFGVQVGPVMRVEDVLAAKPGDPPLQYDDTLIQPTVAELLKHLKDTMEKQTGGRPVFGPERPPQKRM
ncbi:hypothetical protein LTR36_009945 [Oleoguttula mirabilis]|uniref:Uncharacterized protein n=1 Tax=Oleoguttula mirabilis TaxID=1507867 RepID=A0AAV9J4V9_9PEZI|nr:hypothetical protein LTR36_009945 [Oleoguttula mirabilis]